MKGLLKSKKLYSLIKNNMFETVKMKATQDCRIRVQGAKIDVKKWDIVEPRKTEIDFFRGYKFIEVKMEDKKPVISQEKKEVKKTVKK